MPIYEYRCQDCHRRVSLLWLSLADAQKATPKCSYCGGSHLVRLISRVAVVRSEDAHLDDLTDLSGIGDLDESDPKSLGRWMRRMSREMGEDLGGEFDEVVGRLESGQSPEDIERELPDLGLGDSGGDFSEG